MGFSAGTFTSVATLNHKSTDLVHNFELAIMNIIVAIPPDFAGLRPNTMLPFAGTSKNGDLVAHGFLKYLMRS